MNKKILIAIGLAMLTALFLLSNCADPLEATGPNRSPEPIYVVDTISDIDTVVKIDTTVVIDTVPGTDTLIRTDTVIVIDTVITSDTTGHTDTVTVVDTIITPDTVIVSDTVIVPDTVIVADTVVEIDTLTNIDTLIHIDTLTVIDTVVVIDTLTQTDTLTHTDTVIVVVPDTGAFRPFCGALASNQQEIVWMFTNAEGNYRLDFSATLERIQPGQTVTVNVDGQTFVWDPIADAEYVKDMHLNSHATIRITANKPPALGHSIWVCLQVTAL